MPRPGPRPYECVKRAWHSERHQPMRGLIIQHIFRLVRDNHSDATKKNREWQDKLPIVVFKAEEIMYSKANSEAEYSNLDTVWDRANDAIDTIIRREESTETGDLLPPCVEAALNLGCVPVKASRSEMLNNPRTYLRPKHQENRNMPPKGLNDGSTNVPLSTTSSDSPKAANVQRNADSPRLLWESSNNSMTSTLNANIPMTKKVEGLPSFSSTASAHPLCYGTTSSFGFEAHKSDPIIVGVPMFKAKAVTLQDLFPLGKCKNADAQETCEASYEDSRRKGLEETTACDLSLRLGVANNDCSNSIIEERDPIADLGRRPREEFCFFPVESDFRGQPSLFEAEKSESELALKKRKQTDDVAAMEGDDRLRWSKFASFSK